MGGRASKEAAPFLRRFKKIKKGGKNG